MQVWSGRESFRKIVLDPGIGRTIGTADAEVVVHPDRAGSPQFHIVWDGVCAHVQAIDPHRIVVGGEPCWTGEMANRGWMQAGRTTYRFLVEDFTPPPAPVKPSEAALAALARLRGLRDAGTLYGIVDAARADRPIELIEESVDPYASLYDGEQGRAFDDVAPYLIRFERDSGLLERIVGEGWGERGASSSSAGPNRGRASPLRRFCGSTSRARRTRSSFATTRARCRRSRRCSPPTSGPTFCATSTPCCTSRRASWSRSPMTRASDEAGAGLRRAIRGRRIDLPRRGWLMSRAGRVAGR
nr:DUF4123 domain-containing protein [Nannocystis pusilla]